MAEIGGQLRQLTLDVESGVLLQAPRREGVSKILQARPSLLLPLSDGRAQANGAGEQRKHPARCVAVDASFLLREKERGTARPDAQNVAATHVLLQRRAGRRIDRDDPGLSKFRLADREQTVVQIHVGSVERKSLTRAQARSGEEPDGVV
jgi:hypothetical protein